jgi:transcriptional regulator with XRE-family HTH domain
MPTTTKNFAATLRAWRARQGLSQSQAAARLQVSVRTLQGWEIGRLPGPFTRRAIEASLATPGRLSKKTNLPP